jgi:hypothetical protein
MPGSLSTTASSLPWKSSCRRRACTLRPRPRSPCQRSRPLRGWSSAGPLQNRPAREHRLDAVISAAPGSSGFEDVPVLDAVKPPPKLKRRPGSKSSPRSGANRIRRSRRCGRRCRARGHRLGRAAARSPLGRGECQRHRKAPGARPWVSAELLSDSRIAPPPFGSETDGAKKALAHELAHLRLRARSSPRICR